MSKVFLSVGIIAFVVMAWSYYHRQNRPKVTGGPISRPKVLWLFFALFLYYFLGPWIFISTEESQYTSALKTILSIIGLRAVIQPILMYITKNWTPYFGIGFNIVGAVAIILMVFYCFDGGGLYHNSGYIHLFYLIIVVMTLFTDSYYAYRFHSIIGDKTKGNEAIWFASEDDPIFYTINRLTYVMNYLFFSLLFLLLLQIVVS
jgi:hypothetical protein